MASYSFRCQDCLTEMDADWPIGTAPRVTKCPCGRPARLLIGTHVHIAAAATPTSKPHIVNGNLREKRFDIDGSAYKRLRARGLQPPQIDGSAQLERTVSDQSDIDYRRALKIAEANGGGGKQRVLEAVASVEAR